MRHWNVSRVRLIPSAWLLLALAPVILAGCGDDNGSPTGPGPGATSTTMTGVMINAAENGRLTVTIATTTLTPPPGALAARAVAVDASATFRPIGGSVVNLSGTYDADSDTLLLSGGGYTIVAEVEEGDPPSTVGQYDGPNGPGFFGAVATGSTSTPVYCGTYQSNTTSENGNLSFLVSGDVFAGITFSAVTSWFRPFEGSVSGTGTTRTVIGGNVEDGVDSLYISGSFNTVSGVSSGTWTLVDLTDQSAESGTWSAVECP